MLLGSGGWTGPRVFLNVVPGEVPAEQAYPVGIVTLALERLKGERPRGFRLQRGCESGGCPAGWDKTAEG